MWQIIIMFMKKDCSIIKNFVRIPFIRIRMSAANALTCANMALAGFDAVIPLEEVILTMDRVGKSLPHELRCTAQGGLSITPTARKVENRLAKRQASKRGPKK